MDWYIAADKFEPYVTGLVGDTLIQEEADGILAKTEKYGDKVNRNHLKSLFLGMGNNTATQDFKLKKCQ